MLTPGAADSVTDLMHVPRPERPGPASREGREARLGAAAAGVRSRSSPWTTANAPEDPQ